MKLASSLIMISLLWSPTAPAQSDPKFSKQKYLERIGYHEFANATAFVPQNYVQVGVVDSGPVNSSHPDLVGRIAAGSHTTQLIDDKPEHGQSVIGVIAANHNNFGGAGVLGQRALIHYRTPVTKVRSDNVRKANLDVLAQQIRELADKNVDVINLSMALPKRCHSREHRRSVTCDSPLFEVRTIATAISYALSKNVPVVLAAGNSGNKLQRHALQDQGLIVVGAVRSSHKSEFTNSGPGVDIYAPGEDVLYLTERSFHLRGEGTSYATPIVASAVAMIKAVARMQKKSLSATQIKALLLQASQSENESGRIHLGFIFRSGN